MIKKYKLWIHLEEITLDENGNEVDYCSIDEEFLPLPAGTYPSIKEAEEMMEHMHALFND